MTNDAILLADMVEPLERMFEREFPVDPLITESDAASKFSIVEPATRVVHAVRLEESYSNCIFDLDAGIHAARDLEANLRWIALPLDAFRDGEEEYNDVMMSQCKSRGVGIITVQQKGKGLSAKILLDAESHDGDFLEAHPSLEERLANAEPVDAASVSFRVVSRD